jgi:arabinofuranosyltransferase
LSVNRKYFIFILIFFVAHCFFLSWSFLFQNVDDAYISYRYGKNFMNGEGLVYNPGEYVEGYTNFLWTLITAPFTKVSAVDVSILSSSLGLIISIANILLVALISRQFNSKAAKYMKFLVLLPALFLALDDSIAFWAIGGMEFPMYTLFILGIIYNYFKMNESPRHLYYLVAFLMLCTLTRPEGNMIFVITFVHMVLFRKKINNFTKVIITIIISYALFCTAYYGFKYLFYGQLIPNTFYAKGVTDFKMNLVLGAKYLALCTGTRMYIFVFILFIPFKEAFKESRLSYLISFSLVYVTYLVLVGGDWMIANRFFVPVLPILYILSVIGFLNFIAKVSEYYNDEKRALKTAKITVLIISVLLFLLTLSFLEYRQLIIKDNNAKYEMQWSMFGKWLKMNVPQETIIAVGPAGKIPYYSELYTIDMWGLNNEYISKTDSKRLQAGHKKFDFEYVLSLNPMFIIGYAGFTDNDMAPRYEKFNAPEEDYKCYDVVFRLKEQYRHEK